MAEVPHHIAIVETLAANAPVPSPFRRLINDNAYDIIMEELHVSRQARKKASGPRYYARIPGAAE